MQDQIIIFDTTLRDGDQASGYTMRFQDKIRLAPVLRDLGVNIIEAGFPISSPGDFNAVHQISKDMGNSVTICGLARALGEDIERAAKALEPARKPRIHTFISTSPLHMKMKLRKSPEEVMETAMQSVQKARQYVDDVEFSLEDFGRTENDFAVRMIIEAVKAGAATINLPDTVGVFHPFEAYEKIKWVMSQVRAQGYDPIFSVHNHDDLGMATANTIAGILAGCRQAEVTMNGIGERAGNASLEEVVAIIHFKQLGKTTINTKRICPTSELVAQYTRHTPQPNKAIVGKNAFAHEAGIHQHGQLMDARSYEILDPEDFGAESILTFGPRSGRNALKSRYAQLGITFSDEEFQETAKHFTEIADQVISVDDADLIRAIRKGEEIPQYYKLADYHPVRTNGFGAVVHLDVGHERIIEYDEGNGQIDAAIHAIKKAIANSIQLTDFKVEAEGPGSEAVGCTRLGLQKNDWGVTGKSEHTDVVTSAIEAYIDGCNRLKYLQDYFEGKK